MKLLLPALMVAVALAMAGCGTDEAAPEAAAPAVSPAANAANSADPVARMARAVSPGKTGAGVDLRYEILAKPAVGTPFEVEIALVATADAETMDVSISGMPGLTVTNAEVPTITGVTARSVNTHKFTALADQVGVYYVSVAVTTQLAGTTQARTFSIPVLLGEVQAAQKATVEPEKDATGQAIESMPAQETTR